MFDLGRWQRLGKQVGNHIVGGAKNELQFAIVDDPMNKMEMNVDVFCACMVLMVLGKCDSGLVVREEGDRVSKWKGKISDEGLEPQGLLRRMSHCDILALHGRQGDDLLLL